MHPSCRWFLAAGCWLMACLVAPGAFRAAAALSVSRSGAAAATAAAGSSVGSPRPDADRGGFSLGSGFLFTGSMPRAASNAAAAAAAAAALAALATGTLSLGIEGSTEAAAPKLAPNNMLSRRRECVLAALGATWGPHRSTRGSYCPSPLANGGYSAALYAEWMRKCMSGRLQHQPLPTVATSRSTHVPRILSALSGASSGALDALKYGALSGVGALREGALSLYREGEELATCTLRALHAWRHVGPWAPLGSLWRSRLNGRGIIMRRIVR